MPRTTRKRPNWPYRFAWLAIAAALALYIAIQTVVGGMTYGHRPYGTDWGLALVASCLDATFATWFVAVGASIGSFLNVVAFRLPIGRHIGGHSGCFYCQTPIRGVDNVPVLAWLKLRGRCRTCRLPISIQYPLVELGVALAFLWVYISEFSSSGSNLPGVEIHAGNRGLLRMNITQDLVLRVLTYLFALSGLVAAALIAVRRQAVPLKLFLWSLAPWLIAVMITPELIVIRWRESLPTAAVDARLDAFTSVLCGVVAAIAVGRLLAPILYPHFDRTLISADRASTQARQTLGAFAVAGALLGWQAAVPMAWVTAITTLIAILVLKRYRRVAELGDLTVWMWLGLLIFRASWRWLSDVAWVPAGTPAVFLHVGGGLALAPLAWLIRQQAVTPIASPTTTQANLEEEEEEQLVDEQPRSGPTPPDNRSEN